MKKVFIDGSAGTTGLRIFERLQTDKELELITLNEKDRKDPACRKQALNLADIAILCLPDDAAREAAGWVLNPNTVVLDTSTAFPSFRRPKKRPFAAPNALPCRAATPAALLR